MDEIKMRKDGSLISSDWLRGFGPRVSIERSRDVLIIEAPRRAAARKRLAEQVRRIRIAARRNSSVPKKPWSRCSFHTRRVFSGWCAGTGRSSSGLR